MLDNMLLEGVILDILKTEHPNLSKVQLFIRKKPKIMFNKSLKSFAIMLIACGAIFFGSMPSAHAGAGFYVHYENQTNSDIIVNTNEGDSCLTDKGIPPTVILEVGNSQYYYVENSIACVDSNNGITFGSSISPANNGSATIILSNSLSTPQSCSVTKVTPSKNKPPVNLGRVNYTTGDQISCYISFVN